MKKVTWILLLTFVLQIATGANSSGSGANTCHSEGFREFQKYALWYNLTEILM
jgi:hypothetical protein